ncbi:MAG: hypothetical protein HY021_09235 [Burkholderiales bacterium]|nr:hypothetical protein [Burkholderiales bacterium]
MTAIQSPANPFALMLDPAAVLQQIERSGRLERLHSRICRPLDKPVIPTSADAELEAANDDTIGSDDSSVQ